MPLPWTRPKATDRDAVVAGCNAFALDLYDRLRAGEGNLFLSPASIATALAMTYAGARGETAAEMERTLHLTTGPERLHRAMKELLEELNAGGKAGGYRLAVANALWLGDLLPVHEEFVTLIEEHYGAGLHAVDFQNAAEEARKRINAWVEGQTEGKIRDLIAPGMLTPLTVLVLTNAIYFKGDWLAKFEKRQTRDEPFHVAAGRDVPVPLMRRTGEYEYHDAGSFQALRLAYRGDLSMVVLLPKKVGGLLALEESLTPKRLASCLDALRRREVIVLLPRFQVEARFGLNDALAAMGMSQAFDRLRADFSGMVGPPGASIDAVVHQAFVAVDEKGTEAAAATAVVMVARSMATPGPQPPVFRADHPFLFLIRDDRTGLILFLGRVVDP
ncbi:MAG TPA: serpin family protein [Isosphaeraceae bacterium]|jgi:serpin B|nr:serpin family protein [Isosphaeraceae bacterium]